MQANAGVPVKVPGPEHGISSATDYKWKSACGGTQASDVKRVKELEAENARLKRRYADLVPETAAMNDLIAKELWCRARSAGRSSI